MDREKVRAALAAVTLDGGRLYDERNQCYCGMGALLHGAGVPDADMIAFDAQPLAGHVSYVRRLDHEWGKVIAGNYGIAPSSVPALARSMLDAVDHRELREPSEIVGHVGQLFE